MCDNEINIRAAEKSDCEDIYSWRSDTVSRAMFFNSNLCSYEDHLHWFNSSLNNSDRKLYVGESGSKKIGVCRLDRNTKTGVVEVSININPNFRGNGYGRRLLAASIADYQNVSTIELLAKIKSENLASLKIFKSLGFQELSSKENVIILVKYDHRIVFKEVDENDNKVLFELLKQRSYSISHNNIPSWEEHEEFVKAHPYRYWAIILENNCPIGTLYLQDDNSIGLNINEPTLYVVSRALTIIKTKFKEIREKKSKVPPYFYVNVPYNNGRLGELLATLDAVPIQTSYRI